MKLLISATDFKTSDYRAMIGEVRHETPVEQVIFIDTDEWTDLVAGGETLPQRAVADRMATLGSDDPINIQYTSGTTGFPKGATLSHANILNNAFLTTGVLNFTHADRLCIPVPFYHCFGMVMGNLGCTTHGATMVIPSAGFEPLITLQTIQDEQCTGVYGVPTMFIAMLNAPGFASFDLSTCGPGSWPGLRVRSR